MNKQIQLTKTGFDSLQAELDDLINNKRPVLVDRLARARAEGDLKENSDYQNAKDELAMLDGRIEELEDVVKNAKIVNGNADKSSVGVGTKVVLKKDGSEHTFDIVGEWEADPMKKKISHTSPLGTALVGKKVGQKVEVDAPAGKIVYEVVSIE